MSNVSNISLERLIRGRLLQCKQNQRSLFPVFQTTYKFQGIFVDLRPGKSDSEGTVLWLWSQKKQGHVSFTAYKQWNFEQVHHLITLTEPQHLIKTTIIIDICCREQKDKGPSTIFINCDIAINNLFKSNWKLLETCFYPCSVVKAHHFRQESTFNSTVNSFLVFQKGRTLLLSASCLFILTPV